MKKSILFLLISVCAVLVSCTTSQKISVNGSPGTEIYTPTKERLATITNKGTATIKIASDDYYAFLFSKNVGSDDYIPFALDYKYHSYMWKSIQEGVGGAVVITAGLPSSMQVHKTRQAHRYKYLSSHNTNQDMAFSYPQLTTEVNMRAPSVSVDEPKSESKRKLSSSAAAATKTDKSRRTIKDNAAKIEATYKGQGNLRENDNVVEQYPNIKVVIKRVDSSTLSVDVIDNQGESFFVSPGIYKLKSDGNGGYILTHSEISTAIINISSVGKLSYMHPRVNIENGIYTLEISASRI